jgi:peroxiredoxin
LRAYQKELGRIHAAGAELVAVSPQVPDGSLSTAEQNALELEVLSDVGGAVASSYGLLFTLPADVVADNLERGRDLGILNGTGRWELPIPGTFVIAPGGTVALAFVDPDYRNRLEPAAILEALTALGP